MLLYICTCSCVSVCLSLHGSPPDHRKKVHQSYSVKPNVTSNLQLSPAMSEVCDCMLTSPTAQAIWRAMLDQTPDRGDYYCWPHTYSCTHADSKILNSRLPSSLLLCLSFFLGLVCSQHGINLSKKQDPCFLVGQKRRQRVFPLFALSLLFFCFVILRGRLYREGFEPLTLIYS